jgi:bifunctional non-homologous end joining protein LigD
VRTLPSGPKYDGYRMQARIEGQDIRLLRAKTLTGEAFSQHRVGSALLDGEIVVEDEMAFRVSTICSRT